jgi:hypothetical protein
MLDLVTRATQLAALLKQRGETVAVAESSTGGLISATLLAVPGASAYFIGGAVIYTAAARRALLGISDQAMTGMRASTEAYALLVARTARERFAGRLPKPVPRVRPATVMAMPPGIAASPSPAPPSAPSPSKPAAPTASATCPPSPPPRSTFWRRCWAARADRRWPDANLI